MLKIITFHLISVSKCLVLLSDNMGINTHAEKWMLAWTFVNYLVNSAGRNCITRVEFSYGNCVV